METYFLQNDLSLALEDLHPEPEELDVFHQRNIFSRMECLIMRR